MAALLFTIYSAIGKHTYLIVFTSPSLPGKSSTTDNAVTMTYNNIWKSKGLLTKCNGILSCDDVVECINAMCGNINFDAIYYRIIDLTQVIDTTITLHGKVRLT